MMNQGDCQSSKLDSEHKDSADPTVREVLDVLSAHGVRNLVLSPGSRNTPLLIGVNARCQFSTHIINDERTAAFVALGIALVSKRPVGLICTSGTALYNYAPAVAEAYYHGIPLILLTADRPKQWIDQDDSQTLRQPGALRNIVKASFDIGQETGMSVISKSGEFDTEREWYANRIANEAVITAISQKPGPVHINMRFSEPLNQTIPFDKHRRVRIIEYLRPELRLAPDKAKEFAEFLSKKRVMVVAGFMNPDAGLQKHLCKFSALPNVTVLAESLSNLHLSYNACMVDSLLSRMSAKQLEELKPEIVISLGGALVSRQLKDYLRKADIEHWTLGDTPVSVDCFQHLTRHIEINPVIFFAAVTHRIFRSNVTCDYNAGWQTARVNAHNINERKIQSSEWSELKAFNYMLDKIPKSWNLYVSNGTSVRYLQILTKIPPHASYCNRGVSGIEGGNGTALGAAIAYRGTTLLITGDMSFAYDPGILGLTDNTTDLRIIVINNSGGGIFRFIKSTRDLDIREKYLCAPPNLPLSGITDAYSWNYVAAENMNSLSKGMEELINTPHTIMEICVNPEISAAELINYFDNNK
ncbi:MAG: 2-succinyl-5-enolpyruvyl-6-hydroxy-3-cyclohexene-1-carboxylic-acid synthase [Muribaculaceae bacterium]|nr:2-succinyl-5-enolpyruvyl-6-hydroxy-3-cyclohexene-1-carboxylic-acid synthase [Muribaculaceae bacterium]